jgi:cobalamin biosynthesis protein CobW
MALPGVLRIKGRATVRGKAAPAIVQAVGPRADAYFVPRGGVPGLVVIGTMGIDRAAIRAALGD